MRCEVWEPVNPEPKSEKIHQVRLLPNDIGDRVGCMLAVVSKAGLLLGDSRVASLSPDGLHLARGLDPSLGFPLDDKGRIKLVE